MNLDRWRTPVVVVLAAAGLAGAAPAASASGWGTLIPLANDCGTARVDGAGAVTAVCSRFGEVSVVERPPGGSFGARHVLSSTGEPSSPQLAVNAAGEAVALWKEGNNVIRASRRPPGGEFGPAVDVSPAGATRPALALGADGTAVIAYLFNDVQAAIKPAGSATFSAPVGLTSALDVGVAAGSGTAVVAWTNPGGVHAARWRNGALGAPEPLTNDNNTEEPRAAIDGKGRITVSWLSTARRVLVKTTPNPTDPFPTTPEEVSPATVNVHHSVLAVSRSGEGTVISWQSWNGSGGALEASTRVGDGAFTTPVSVSEYMGSAAAPAAVDDDDVATMLVQGGSVRFAAGGAFGPVSPLGGAPDANGHQTIVRGSEGVRGWDTSAPELRGVSIPSTATAGKPVTFSVTPFDDWSDVFTRWDFGDGATTTGAAASYGYPRAGTYTVTVTGTDALGASTTHRQSIGVAPPQITRLGGSVSARWHVRGSRSTLRRLRISRVAVGASVRLTCSGRGCPWARRSVKVGRSGVANGLTAAGSRRTFRAGARLEVRISGTNAIGRVVRYTFRRGHQPQRSVLCLSPGASRPARC